MDQDEIIKELKDEVQSLKGDISDKDDYISRLEERIRDAWDAVQ
jgi:peptidoglycan hydrolase CwlO-like protein